MKPPFRFFRGLLALAAGAGLQWSLSATIIDFDSPKPGEIGRQVPGVDFTSGATIVRAGLLEPQPHTGSQYLVTPGDTLRISFSQPVGYVRVRVGNTTGFNKFQAVMRAYGAGNLLVGMTELPLGTEQRNVVFPMQVSRALGRDIRGIEITCRGVSQVAIDTLEYGQINAGTISWYNFDNLAPYATIERLPGATFLAPLPQVTRGSLLFGGTWSAPYALEAPITGELVHPEPMVITFDPPQQYVQVKVGNPDAVTASFRVVFKAYDSRARTGLLTSSILYLPNRVGIVEQIECACVDGPNIAAVELFYLDDRYGYREVIDDLLFGPRNPTMPADSQGPVITIQSPRNNDLVRQDIPGSTTTTITVSGTATEDSGFSQFVAYVQDEQGTVFTSDVRPQLAPGSARDYTFAAQVVLRLGNNRLWLAATDGAGNTATNLGGPINVAFGLPPVSVTSITPATVQRWWLFREAGGGQPALQTPDASVVTIRGQNLNRYIGVILNCAAGQFQPDVYYHGDTEAVVYVPQVAFEYGDGTLNVRVMDYYRNPAGRVLASAALRLIGDPQYPQVWGFGFANRGSPASEGEFYGAFGWQVYSSDWWCGPTLWAEAVLWPAYEYIMDQMATAGSCVGMAATSLLMANGYLPYRNWDDRQLMRLPSGFLASDLRPAAFYQPDCGPQGPENLWAYIRSMHALQLSAPIANRLLDQVSIGSSINNTRGNPLARLSEIRANPTNWIVCMENRIGEGHAVVPYRVVGNRIYVYDSNHPYDHAQAPDSEHNRRALESYIDIDPVNNVFSFPNLNYRGTWIFTFPLSVWANQLRGQYPPPIGLGEFWRTLGMLVFGGARPEYTTEDGLNHWGWTQDGTFVDSFTGAIPMPILGGAANDGGASWPLLVDDRHSRLLARLHHQGGGYNFVTMQNDRVFQLKTWSGYAGDTDNLSLTKVQNNLSSFGFAPARDGAPFVATVGTKSTATERLFQVGALNVPQNELVVFGLTTDGQGLQIRNTTSRALQPWILLRQGTATPAQAGLLFVPPSLSSGANATFTPQAGTANLTAAIDQNGDGTVDDTRTLQGRSMRLEDNPTAQDLNNNGITDDVDIAFGQSMDANHNGVPDEAEAPGTRTTPTDGDWSAKTAILANTSEAQLMVRTGDIDNLGFGWPDGFDPFSGNATPVHAYPWDPDPLDPAGTDQIMVPSSYTGNPPFGEDGYTSTTTRPGNLPRAIALQYAHRMAGGLAVNNAVLQLFVDDFQAPVWGSSFEVYLNSRRAGFLEEVLNHLEQTGPVGKLITMRIPDEFLPEVASGSLSLLIDDLSTGAGDGFAIDFVKLLLNTAGTFRVGAVSGTVRDAATGQPVVGATVRAANMAEVLTDGAGQYILTQVPAGLTVVTAAKFGYQSQSANVDVIASETAQQDFHLTAVPTADVALILSTKSAGDIGTQLIFTVVAVNNGPETATGPMVRIPMPQGTAFVFGAPPPEGLVGASDTEVVFWMGDMPAGVARTATVGFQAMRRGMICAFASLTADQPDPNPDNNVSMACVTVTGPYGGIFLTGHDADAHAAPEVGPNPAGAQHLIARAVEYVTFGKLSPRILLVSDLENPGQGHSDPRLGLTAAGYGFDMADSGLGLGGALDLRTVSFTDYDAIVVASTYGGWLKQAEIDILNRRAPDLSDFINQGGGVVALSQADSPTGAAFAHAFGFFPAASFRTRHQEEQGFVLTDLGWAMGLADTDIVGNSDHGIFESNGGLTPVDLDAEGHPVSLAMRGQALSPGGVGEQSADLGLEKVVASQDPRVGVEVLFNLGVTNSGPNAATGVTVVDELSAAVELVRAFADVPASISLEGSRLVVEIDSLEIHAGAQITVVVRPLQAGLWLNRAWVRGLQADGNLDNNLAAVELAILPANEPPTVSITAPEDQQSFEAPANLRLAATATDDTGIARVDFYINGIYLDSASKWPYEIAWTGVLPGAYSLSAIAIDAQGLAAKSDAVTITVTSQIMFTAIRLERDMVVIEWIGGPVVLLGCADLTKPDWQPVGLWSESPAKVSLAKPTQFFRLMRP